MNKYVLIIDDDKTQAEQLCTALGGVLPEIKFDQAHTEEDIERKIVEQFYSVAIVDLRMDGFSIDGFGVIDKISIINPYAKIITISAFTGEYLPKLNDYISKGKILAISEKKEYARWTQELKEILEKNFNMSQDPIAVQVLENMYAEAKNETDTYIKGKMFENFVVVLFRQMGFKYIETRVRDAASNEIDLVVRNDIEDPFFSKFGRYIFAECKNKNGVGFNKNDLIVFRKKVESSAGDSNLGIVFTTGSITQTVYQEALKDSISSTKILYMSSSEISRLIHSQDLLEELKEIIDSQVE